MRNLQPQRRSHRWALLPAACLTALLAACGSGDGGEDVSDDAPAGPTTITLTGTAATGEAIGGGEVEAVCATGSGQAKTGTDGTYTLKIKDAVAPCLLRVTSADGNTVLHGAADGTGSALRGNLTPVTELVMAQLLSRLPADAWAAGKTKPLKSAALKEAAGALQAMLASAGITYAADPLAGPLAVGDEADRALDALAVNLAATSTSMAQATAAVIVAAGGSAPAGVTLSALPPAQLMAPAAANCPSLRSGNYRLVYVGASEGEPRVTTFTLDASKLELDNEGYIAKMKATGPCQYTVDKDSQAVVSSAGVMAVTTEDSGAFLTGIAFPLQDVPVSATTGLWNLIGLAVKGSASTPTVRAGSLTIDATGRATAINFCSPLSDCAALTPGAAEAFTADAEGGFRFDDSRAFAYRSGTGATMIVMTSGEGALNLLTPQVARPEPVIGTVSRSWNVSIRPDYTVAGLDFGPSENTITAFDADTGIATRSSIIDFSTGATRLERLEFNRELPGFTYRIPETVTASNGASSSVGEFYALSIVGMGFVPVAFPGNHNLVLSVTKPAP